MDSTLKGFLCKANPFSVDIFFVYGSQGSRCARTLG